MSTIVIREGWIAGIIRVVEEENDIDITLFTINSDGVSPCSIFSDLICGVDEI
jgi:hypothetical protein